MPAVLSRTQTPALYSPSASEHAGRTEREQTAPSLRTVNFKVFPLQLSTACCTSVFLLTVFPSIAVMTSPTFSPASMAGLMLPVSVLMSASPTTTTPFVNISMPNGLPLSTTQVWSTTLILTAFKGMVS